MKEFPLIKKWLDLDVRDHTTRLVVDAYDLEAKLKEGFELTQCDYCSDNEWTTHEEILGGKNGRENIATHKCLGIGKQLKHKRQTQAEASLEFVKDFSEGLWPKDMTDKAKKILEMK